MKITLEFTDDDDREAARRAVHADTAWFTLWDLDQQMRSALKHDTGLTIEQLRQSLHDGLASHGVTLDGMLS